MKSDFSGLALIFICAVVLPLVLIMLVFILTSIFTFWINVLDRILCSSDH